MRMPVRRVHGGCTSAQCDSANDDGNDYGGNTTGNSIHLALLREFSGYWRAGPPSMSIELLTYSPLLVDDVHELFDEGREIGRAPDQLEHFATVGEHLDELVEDLLE